MVSQLTKSYIRCNKLVIRISLLHMKLMKLVISLFVIGAVLFQGILPRDFLVMCFENTGEVHVEISGQDDCSDHSDEELGLLACTDCEDTVISNVDDYRLDVLDYAFSPAIISSNFAFSSFVQKAVRAKLKTVQARGPTVTHLKSVIFRI